MVGEVLLGFLEEIRRFGIFVELRGLLVGVVTIKGIAPGCKEFFNEGYSDVYHRIFKWLSIATSEWADEVEAALHFDDCKLNFCETKSQSLLMMIIVKKNENN